MKAMPVIIMLKVEFFYNYSLKILKNTEAAIKMKRV